MKDEKLLQPYEISRATYRCSSLERKILYFGALIVQRERDTKNGYDRYIAEFSITQMLQTLGIAKYDDAKRNIIDAIENISRTSITLKKDEKHLLVISWIQKGVFNDEKDKCILTFSEDIGKLFIDCKERFSLINPLVIGSLKSFYAMRYYELALSYRGYTGRKGNPERAWYFTRTIDDLREMFEIDAYNGSQGTKNLINKVVNEPIAELNAVNNEFRIDIEKIPNLNDKRRLDGIAFKCTAKAVRPTKAKATLTEKVESERAEARAERAPIERAKALYPEEFTKRMKARKAADPIELEMQSEYFVYKSMVVDDYAI